ncbi:MAG: ribosome silencing factor [Polyangiaceae bacterium]|nr:ribosome silencing factor [Polyangiaceae bacterium]
MATKKRTGSEPADDGAGVERKQRVSKAGSAPAKARAKGAAARPRLRASHATVDTAAPRAKKKAEGAGLRKGREAPPRDFSPRPPPSKRTPIGAPKRATKREAPPAEPTNRARELALSIAMAGLDKKAVAIEILDVTGKVDYADFLVVMTGRSDRHVHSIATGIEEALLRKNKVKPLSMEGLSTATWVLIDFGEVVVHVFQEDSRRLYDIEGLWIDAGRVPLPENEQKVAAQIDATDNQR